MDKKDILNYIDEIDQEIKDLAYNIWEHPEISGEEEYGANSFRKILQSYGFRIKEVNNMPHAFVAEYGQGSPVIGILGEYDALPNLSQAIDIQFNPIEVDGPGHACGHNLLGGGSLGAALAIKKYIEESNISGTIQFYGCPEEETLVGKVKMIKEGAFEDCDIALSWHPLNVNAAMEEAYLANNSIKFKFHGISSHAAQSPETGRSALDAVELMNVGANYLREHVIDKARIHYTITNTGGSPNIIPKEAESWYYIRAPRRKDVEEITERLLKIAEGAALMTETTVEPKIISGCYEMLPNNVLFKLTYKNMLEVDLPQYSQAEQNFARRIQETIDSKSVEQEIRKLGGQAGDEKVYIHEGIMAKHNKVSLTASSDSGDVSWIMPMNLFLTASWPLGVAPHSWQATASSGSSMGMKGMIYAAKVMAATAFDLLNDRQLVEDSIEEFKKRTNQAPYKSPLE